MTLKSMGFEQRCRRVLEWQERELVVLEERKKRELKWKHLMVTEP